jgi:hypothetical protein
MIYIKKLYLNDNCNITDKRIKHMINMKEIYLYNNKKITNNVI